jgi:hypothetical protein
LGKQRRGTKTHDCGYRLSQSDRSIGSALLQDARAFPHRVPACFLPSQIVLVLVVVLVLGLWFEAWQRDKTVNAGRQPGAQACTRDTHLFATPWTCQEVEDENDDEDDLVAPRPRRGLQGGSL